MILQDISFQIPQGRILMVLGENGSGKTTLIKSMLQQLPYTGDILYQHQHISHMQEKERAKIFYGRSGSTLCPGLDPAWWRAIPEYWNSFASR